MNHFMEIRELTVNEIDNYEKSIAELLTLCISSTYSMSAGHDLIVAEKIESLKSHLQSETAYVIAAFEREELIGFVWAYPVSTLFETVLHIAYIAVLEKAQGKGVGLKLLLVVQEIAKRLGLKSIELIVGKNNESANCFYRDNNFFEDRIIMRKEL